MISIPFHPLLCISLFNNLTPIWILTNGYISVLDAVAQIHNICRAEVEGTIKSWLRHAKERKNYKKKNDVENESGERMNKILLSKIKMINKKNISIEVFLVFLEILQFL